MIRGGLDPYQELANAIIIQAAVDYRTAMRYLSKHQLCDDSTDGEILTIEWKKTTAKDIERFFLSTWFETLTEINGRELLDRLRSEFPNVEIEED